MFQRIDNLIESVRAACGGVAPLELTATGIGFFPNGRRPRVIWAGINGEGGKLDQLQQKVETSTAVFANTIDNKPFAAHLTIARIKEINAIDVCALEQAALELIDRKFGTWTARSVEIIRSELGRAGSRYSQIAEVRLIPPNYRV